MAPWEDFNHVYSFNKKYSYDNKVFDQIVSNRRALENQLFADRLLSLLGIKGGMLLKILCDCPCSSVLTDTSVAQ